MIGAGKHKAKKIGGDFGYTKEGKEQIAIQFRLTESSETITWYGYFSEKTEKSTVKAMALLNIASDLSNVNDASETEVTLVIEEEADQQGVLRAKVRWINGDDGVALAKRMDDGQRAAFAAKLAGKLVKAKADLGAVANGKATGEDPFT